MPESPAEPAQPDLPDDLAAQVADAAFAPDEQRERQLAALGAAHPAHAAAIARTAALIHGSAQLLAQVFPERPAELPEHIGRYRVLRVLGEGAFGIVYLAVETAPVRREVAIKLLRPGAGDRHTLQRFAAEQQLLAGLDHPAIARILEASATADGRPYFVMDRIDGLPLTQYAATRALALPQRLQLFAAVCRGVDHAHQRGVVHRDLKPANVLVAEVDGQPLPRIIDFGVAKVLGQGSELPTFATEPGRMVGTPGYMSPEQRRGAAVLDARADVFALGVMLYELLVGERPWPADAPAEAAEPPRASAARQARARRAGRGDDPVAARLRGDLDWILAKALQPDPAQRYACAGALGDELTRHLAGGPVQAGPPSAIRRVRRTLRRHRATLAWSAALALVAAAGLAAASHFHGAAARADERRIAEGLRMASTLLERAAAPHAADRLDDAMRMQLARDAVEVHERLREAPLQPLRPEARRQELAARLLLAATQHALGQFDTALQQAEAVLPAAQALFAEAPLPAHQRLVADAEREIGRSAFLLRYHGLARAATTRAIAAYDAIEAAAPGSVEAVRAKALLEHASALGATGDAAGRMRVLEQVAATLRRRHAKAPDDESTLRDLIRTLSGIANHRTRAGEVRAAAEALDEAQALLAGASLPLDDERARIANRRGRLRLEQGRLAEALADAAAAAAAIEKVLARQPQRHVERLVLLDAHHLAAEAHEALGDRAAADAAVAALIAAADAGTAAAQASAAAKLVQLARARLEHGDRRHLGSARLWLAKAVPWLPDGSPAAAQQRLEARLLLASAVKAIGQPDDLPAARQLAADAAKLAPTYAGYAQGLLAERLLANGDTAGAAALAAIEAAADDEDRAIRRLALLGAFRLTRELAAGDAAPRQRQRALQLAAAFAAEPVPTADPAGRLGWAQAIAVGAALGANPPEAAQASALLRQLRARVPAPDWDESLWLALQRQELVRQAATADPAATFAAIEALAADLGDPRLLLELCGTVADCVAAAPGARRQEIADATAAAVLRRAVAVGLRGRQAAAARPELQPLRDGPAVAAALAAIPD